MNDDSRLVQFNKILNNFKIQAQCIDFHDNENYFFYDVVLHGKTKVKDILKFSEEIALLLKASCKPSCKVIHDLGLVRVEFVKRNKTATLIHDLFSSLDHIPDGVLPMVLGKTTDGKYMWTDLAKCPHMIVAGTTGSGKSTLLHTIIANVINFSNAELYLVDPKGFEFKGYDKIKCANIKIVSSYEETTMIMNYLVDVMNYRYDLIRGGMRDLHPIVFIIDEFADLILQDDNEAMKKTLCLLAQKCRAAKIHIILSTQRPSADIIDGTIKANFPARVACKVASGLESRIILDCNGAENLSGNGDAIIKDYTNSLVRFQGAFSSLEMVNSMFEGLYL